MIEVGQVWEHWATRSRLLVREVIVRTLSGVEVRCMEASIDSPYRAIQTRLTEADLLAWHWLVATVPAPSVVESSSSGRPT